MNEISDFKIVFNVINIKFIFYKKFQMYHIYALTFHEVE